MERSRKGVALLSVAVLLFIQSDIAAQESAKRRTPNGDLVAVLSICSDASGKPYKVEVARSSGDRQKDQAAVAAARKWKFPPQQADGIATPECQDVPVEMKSR